jgi:3-vinyl bacteriochlorophyllide hydratase
MSDGQVTRSTPRSRPAHAPLYTPEQRRRRDESRWTLVQGVLAPAQFAVFAVSTVLVLHFLATGEGYAAAAASVVVKTGALLLIMVTGCMWEKAVFDRYLLAPAFFWEDVVSFAVIALHLAYVAALYADLLAPTALMVLALVAYAAYLLNAAQFVLKLRRARLDTRSEGSARAAPIGGTVTS